MSQSFHLVQGLKAKLQEFILVKRNVDFGDCQSGLWKLLTVDATAPSCTWC